MFGLPSEQCALDVFEYTPYHSVLNKVQFYFTRQLQKYQDDIKYCPYDRYKETILRITKMKGDYLIYMLQSHDNH